MTLEGATDRLVFDAYVTQALLPHLRPGQVVVLDNLSAHKGERIRHLVEAVGCRLLFLPAYSPDFNPIEDAFTKLKAHLRRLAARTFETLLAAIGAAFDAVAAADAHAFFAHCGFPLQDQEL